MIIKLSDGTELFPILVTGGQRYVQGQSRDTLSFVFPASESMEALDAAFASENCETITINDGEKGHIYKAYSVRAELKKESEEVSPATAEAAAVYEDRITISMSQRTYLETQLAALQTAVQQVRQ